MLVERGRSKRCRASASRRPRSFLGLLKSAKRSAELPPDRHQPPCRNDTVLVGVVVCPDAALAEDQPIKRFEAYADLIGGFPEGNPTSLCAYRAVEISHLTPKHVKRGEVLRVAWLRRR